MGIYDKRPWEQYCSPFRRLSTTVSGKGLKRELRDQG